MDRSRRRAGLLAIGLLLLVWPAAASEVSNGPMDEVAELTVDVSLVAECASEESLERLIVEIRLRTASPVRALGPHDEGNVRWLDAGEGCGLSIGDHGQVVFLPLDQGAGLDAMRAAASRVVFLLGAPQPNEEDSSGTSPDEEREDEERRSSTAAKDDKENLVGHGDEPRGLERLREAMNRKSPSAARVTLIPGTSFSFPYFVDTPFFSLNLIFGEAPEVVGLEAGFVNTVTGDMLGLQAAFSVNVVSGSATGAQIAGLANINLAESWGMQLAGTCNYARGQVVGAQVAGLLNRSGIGSRGLQISHLNLAEDMTGVQIGVLNVAGEMRGAQLGLVNVSQNVDYPIGLVNVVRGQSALGTAAIGSDGFLSVGLLHGGSRLQYLYLGGYHRASPLPVGIGIGASLSAPSLGLLGSSIEAVAWQILRLEPLELAQLFEARLLGSLRLGGRFELRFGPTLKAMLRSRPDGYPIPRSRALIVGVGSEEVFWLWPELLVAAVF